MEINIFINLRSVIIIVITTHGRQNNFPSFNYVMALEYTRQQNSPLRNKTEGGHLGVVNGVRMPRAILY